MKKAFRMCAKSLFITVITLVAGFSSCQQEGPLTPAQQNPNIRTSDQLTFLKSLTPGLMKSFTLDQYITVVAGGIMTTGDDTCGYSSLQFMPNDVPADTTITFNWDSQGYISDLAPHGIVFNNPVAIHLSYKDADLTGVVEDSLKLWYYNDVNAVWEMIGGTVNKDEKRIEAVIEHFSRYGIAAD